MAKGKTGCREEALLAIGAIAYGADDKLYPAWCNKAWIYWWKCRYEPKWQFERGITAQEWEDYGLALQEDICNPVCLPDCQGKECGGDGCGGTCGDCPKGYVCDSGACAADCPTLCEGHCGNQGQTGECQCGDCPEGTSCDSGHCVCQPDCEGKDCGGDNCGGNCGKCPPNYICGDDQTCEPVCSIFCSGKSCTPPDLVGICSCGDCPEGHVCNESGTDCVLDCELPCKDVGCGTTNGPLGNTFCFCGDCGPGALCWNGVCTTPQCSPACEAAECPPQGCEQDCPECSEDEVCSSGGMCCGPMEAELIADYLAIIDSPAVASALDLAPGEKDVLLEAAWQLECNSLQSWSEFDSLTFLTFEEARRLWLRRAAVFLYNNVHDVYPWKWYEFPAPHLQLLLGFNVAEDAPKPAPWEEPAPNNFMDIWVAYGDQYWLGDSSPNPAIEMLIAHEIYKAFAPTTPQAAAYALVEHMHATGWVHETESFSAGDLGLDGSLATLWALRRTTCHISASIVRSVLRAFGVPVAKITLYFHSGIVVRLPDGDLVMPSADELCQAPLKYLPAHESFWTAAQCQEWAQSSPAGWGPEWENTACSFNFQKDKDILLRWFQYCADPVYGAQLKTQYCQMVTWCWVEGKACTSWLHKWLHEPYDIAVLPCPDDVLLIDDPDIVSWVYEKLYAYYMGKCPPVPWSDY